MKGHKREGNGDSEDGTCPMQIQGVPFQINWCLCENMISEQESWGRRRGKEQRQTTNDASIAGFRACMPEQGFSSTCFYEGLVAAQ